MFYDFIIFKDEEHLAFGDKCHTFVKYWQAEWMNAAGGNIITIASATDGYECLESHSNILVTSEDDLWCVFDFNKENYSRFYNNLIGVKDGEYFLENSHSSENNIAIELIENALKSLFSDMASGDNDAASVLTASQVDSLPVLANKPGSGCVKVDISIDDLNFKAIFSQKLPLLNNVRRVFSENTTNNLEEVKYSITNNDVKCRIKLGTAQLSVEDLVSLQIGDVIRLNESIETPASLLVNDVETKCKCLVGKVDGNKAALVVQN